ncbi:MAG: hypothetical protein WED04_09600 [Promethearchaeati archaeon SRVP18_Atabeyarchaeia-1]
MKDEQSFKVFKELRKTPHVVLRDEERKLVDILSKELRLNRLSV